MFTPPPSPLPVPRIIVTTDDGTCEYSLSSALSTASEDSDTDGEKKKDRRNMQAVRAAAAAIAKTHQRKQISVRRIGWAILLVPAVLVLVALTSRRLSTFHVPDELDIHAEGWENVGQRHRHPQGHYKRVPQTLSLSDPAAPPSTGLVTSSTGSGSGSASQITSQNPTLTTSLSLTQQTIPPVPGTSDFPVLPTPFPEPYDSLGVGSNLTTQSCEVFFQNMTQTEPFRDCRPFSLLEELSDDFTEAQTNLTALNAIIWGTCNTDVSFPTCTSNMDWFASALSSVCATELSENYATVQQTLIGLQSYALLRATGCLVDQATNTYCYAQAVQAVSPADFYLYQLPLGTGMPSSVTPSCSTCAASILSLYADALKAGNSSAIGLKDTYESAAQSAESTCGNGYAQIGVVTSAAPPSLLRCRRDGWTAALLPVLLGAALGTGMLLLP
ncbi:hypothetical protein M0805_007111 [Coniferiporia weirii]|nr:hypothetical protein M0805_007111 [Coniferiporia weirii]